jgi:hypothetical protein
MARSISPSGRAAADINRDGILDVVAGTGAGAQVLLGTGGGTFRTDRASNFSTRRALRY